MFKFCGLLCICNLLYVVQFLFELLSSNKFGLAWALAHRFCWKRRMASSIFILQLKQNQLCVWNMYWWRLQMSSIFSPNVRSTSAMSSSVMDMTFDIYTENMIWLKNQLKLNTVTISKPNKDLDFYYICSNQFFIFVDK